MIFHVDNHDPDDPDRLTTIFIKETDTITDEDGTEYVLVVKDERDIDGPGIGRSEG